MQALRTVAARRAPLASRSIVSSARLRSGGSHVSNNDPEVLEREKQRNLKHDHDHVNAPHKKHAPGWNEQLASDSEATIKADQAPVDSPEELTKVTIEYVTRKHEEIPADTDAKATTDSFRSTKVERDEVHGPLSKAGGKSH